MERYPLLITFGGLCTSLYVKINNNCCGSWYCNIISCRRNRHCPWMYTSSCFIDNVAEDIAISTGITVGKPACENTFWILNTSSAWVENIHPAWISWFNQPYRLSSTDVYIDLLSCTSPTCGTSLDIEAPNPCGWSGNLNDSSDQGNICSTCCTGHVLDFVSICWAVSGVIVGEPGCIDCATGWLLLE